MQKAKALDGSTPQGAIARMIHGVTYPHELPQSFLRAARNLASMPSSGLLDAMPAAFLARHAWELHLKNILVGLHSLLMREGVYLQLADFVENESDLNGHKIVPLAERIGQVFAEHLCETDYPKSDVERVIKVAKKIGYADPLSIGFRYVRKKAEVKLPDDAIVMPGFGPMDLLDNPTKVEASIENAPIILGLATDAQATISLERVLEWIDYAVDRACQVDRTI